MPDAAKRGGARRLLVRLAAIVERVPVVGPGTVVVAKRLTARPRTAWRRRRQAARQFHVSPPPRPVAPGTLQPPAVADPDRIVAGHSADTDPPVLFDIELFEALNAEYDNNRLVPEPPLYDEETLLARSMERMLNVHRTIDLADKRVLQFGCGHGYEVWCLTHAFGAEAWGIDILEREPWAALTDDRTRFTRADMTVERVFEDAFFDRIVSINVFEHVARPVEGLEALYRVLRPGGFAWISANLYRGALASHRYRDVHFPWPHLLFDDTVFAEHSRRVGMPPEGAAWVNRMVWEQYEVAIRAAGFRIRRLRFRERPVDEAFYARFEGILGRYPRADLRRDFFEVILERPSR
jgi:SAM-dependent methyltransferase